MQQECYSGTHLSVYVPIGVVAVFMYCLLPPLVSYLLMWRHRKQLDDHHVGQVYGFLYKRYRERYWYWESVLQLETLALVAVEVFGRALVTSHQALLLLAVFLVIGAVNMTCSAMRSHFLVVLEFLSLSVLSLTVTLGLYFAIEGEAVTASEASAVGIIMLVINASLLAEGKC
ncbi:hypothetical protein HXX76_005215 [Chlamydomonas incerta]|uniref:TRP C-terminal domain-containing protein n=1 Tax=Chlamydomonas incerta TaxID=51695 RepID=A0A835T4K8_CHLIN|nr:hypothetical protein HXX76_005215 [Chlamydomonas incerta]|eukprot:KAG2438668.1 hypothetical protein HXX76_005215 [Chlamydomonas incerta]